MAGKKAWFHTKAFPKLRAATTVVNSAFAQPPLVLQVCGAARKCAFHVVLSRVLREDREFMTWVQRGRFLVLPWQWPRLVGLCAFTVLLFQLCIVYYSLQLHKCLLPSVFYLVKKKTKKEALLFTLFESMMVSLSLKDYLLCYLLLLISPSSRNSPHTQT